jgi:hypothetical protein
VVTAAKYCRFPRAEAPGVRDSGEVRSPILSVVQWHTSAVEEQVQEAEPRDGCDVLAGGCCRERVEQGLQGIPGLTDSPATADKRIDDQRVDPITAAIASSNIFTAMRTKSIATQHDVKTTTILSSEQTAAQAVSSYQDFSCD